MTERIIEIVKEVRDMRDKFEEELNAEKSPDEWELFIIKYFNDPDKIYEFLDLITLSRMQNIDLNEDEDFKLLTRATALKQFVARTQTMFKSEEAQVGLMG